MELPADMFHQVVGANLNLFLEVLLRKEEEDFLRKLFTLTCIYRISIKDDLFT